MFITLDMFHHSYFDKEGLLTILQFIFLTPNVCTFEASKKLKRTETFSSYLLKPKGENFIK